MSMSRHHSEWLSLVPVSGPFLSLPVLLARFGNGLDGHDSDHFRILRLAHTQWHESKDDKNFDASLHDAWIKFVLRETLEFDEEYLLEGQGIPQSLQHMVAEHGVLLKPDLVVKDPEVTKPRLLIHKYPPSQELTSYVRGSRWKASPDTRMTELLQATGVRLGLVTNGEHWMLVDAQKNEPVGYASWYASLWLEEKITLQAFRTLLTMERFFGVSDEETIEALLSESASNQQEVTEQLGAQVLRAVEVLVQSLDKADQDYGRELLEGVSEKELYESALNVMMRLVFLFCAEERELIPTKPFPIYEQNYSVSAMSRQLREIADQQTEELLERRYDAWPRVLSAFRAVYGGLSHEDIYLPAYGGKLFDPDRYPFLEGRRYGTSWETTVASPLPVNNRTVLHLLEALQILRTKLRGGGHVEARRVSFRALGIEQIGHVYEGLLDHTAARAGETTLGLVGKKEPEISLSVLEAEREKGDEELFAFLKKETGGQRKWGNYIDAEIDDADLVRLRTACGNDEGLTERVLPYAKLLRDDSFGYPVVITEGSVFVTAGTDRRSSGTHYTPRTLTEPIVRYTLEPLVYEGPSEGKDKKEWKLKSATELLDLNICDMACGSGAFLVQACRYMAERLMEAWDQAKGEQATGPAITPVGKASAGSTGELLIPDDPDECRTYAMRLVAQRCLYGVDINPLAVEMAKLSLWLLTLAKDKPFEFLDHTIRCGDSLVGIHDIEQLKHFSLKPDNSGTSLFKGPIDKAVDEAITLRLQLEDMPSNTVEDVEAQEQLLADAEDKIARLRYAADLLVSAEFWGEGSKDKQEKVRHAGVIAEQYVEKGPTEEFKEKAEKERRGQKMFHWPLEFPEVIEKRGGFDGFVGNPPFMGGSRIATSFGVPYRDFLVDIVAEGRRGQRGQADLCAYFLCCLNSLACPTGHFGILATNTISQGDTRIAALDFLIECGLTVYRAVPSQKWPGTASLEVAALWMRNGDWNGNAFIDSRSVKGITSFLAEIGEVSGPPKKLASNKNQSFEGSRIEGQGFVLSPDERQKLIEEDSRNSDVLYPFLRGEDFTNRPDQTPAYWVINFHTWPLDRSSAPSGYEGPVAADYPKCLEIVQKKVKPQRDALPQTIAINITTSANWWRYRDVCPALHAALKETGVKRVLFHAFTSKYVAFAFVNCGTIYAAPHNIFVFDRWEYFAALQSSFHIEWAYEYCSTLETRLRYTRSSIFETFPFPTTLLSLGEIGESYHEIRSRTMQDHQEGLTKTYNRFHDLGDSSADIQKLRDLHIEMDQAVAAAYGWPELNLDHGFRETKQGLRFTISEQARREVLQRLLKLNHDRYEEGVKQGLHDKKKRAKKKSTPRKKVAKKKSSAPTLFDKDDAEGG